MAPHNCFLDADYFFPAFSLAALASDPTLSYDRHAVWPGSSRLAPLILPAMPGKEGAVIDGVFAGVAGHVGTTCSGLSPPLARSNGRWLTRGKFEFLVVLDAFINGMGQAAPGYAPARQFEDKWGGRQKVPTDGSSDFLPQKRHA